MACKSYRCNAKKNLDANGYCPAHKPTSSNQYGKEFDQVNEKLDNLIETMNLLREENRELKKDVGMLKEENAVLKAKVNLNFYANDKQNQYGRKESFRIHKYPEPANNDDDNSFEAVEAVAKKLNIDISKDMIQRCHRVGKVRRRPRSIIVKLKSWDKRMEFIKAKRNLRNADWSELSKVDCEDNADENEDGKNALDIFITEDLSPFRLKILHYIKDLNKEGPERFDRITTFNGSISCREKATQNWLSVSSPEDFLEAGIKMDKSKFPEILFIE